MNNTEQNAFFSGVAWGALALAGVNLVLLSTGLLFTRGALSYEANKAVEAQMQKPVDITRLAPTPFYMVTTIKDPKTGKPLMIASPSAFQGNINGTPVLSIDATQNKVVK